MALGAYIASGRTSIAGLPSVRLESRLFGEILRVGVPMCSADGLRFRSRKRAWSGSAWSPRSD